MSSVAILLGALRVKVGSTSLETDDLCFVIAKQISLYDNDMSAEAQNNIYIAETYNEQECSKVHTGLNIGGLYVKTHFPPIIYKVEKRSVEFHMLS